MRTRGKEVRSSAICTGVVTKVNIRSVGVTPAEYKLPSKGRTTNFRGALLTALL